jgi:hypothetical protein
MAISGKMKLSVYAGMLIALAGCAREKRQPPKPAAVKIPAKNVGFRLLPPDKEKRCGLYAVSVNALVSAKSMQRTFAQAADGKLPKPVAGQGVILIGKLPGTVPHRDFLQADAGRMVGSEIEIPVRYVQYVGAVKEKAVKAVYFTVNLPPLPAGKYRAAVYFDDWTYEGDKGRITGSSWYKPVAPCIKPLVCEFEVQPPPAPRATLSAKRKKFVSGKPLEFVVNVKNPGKKPLTLFDAGWPGNWRLLFTPKDGGVPRVARLAVKVDRGIADLSLPGGGRVTVPVKLDGMWQFHDVRPLAAEKDLARPLSALPPGKYTVTASYEHRAGHPTRERCPYWHGAIHAGSLEIEVVKPAGLSIPAKSVSFHLVKPDKEKRSGLYACSPYAAYKKFSVPWLFSSCADGKSGKPGGAARQPTAGKRIWLVGKLPGTVLEKDFFKPGAGTIKGGEIEISVKYVRYTGRVKRLLAPRAAYFTVSLPALPAGKYRATVKFQDWQHMGDRSRITFPPQRKSVAPRFKPLVCEFEVKAAAK